VCPSIDGGGGNGGKYRASGTARSIAVSLGFFAACSTIAAHEGGFAATPAGGADAMHAANALHASEASAIRMIRVVGIGLCSLST
jgi:hypothetical protein